jgi:peptidoglycan/xylan/chitin deacetylase (PgdA/CDA1 family)
MKSQFVKYTIIPGVFSCLPQAILNIISPSRLIMPYYHMISDEKVDHTINLYQHKSTNEFISDLDYLLNHYEPVGLKDLIETINSGGVMPKPSFHLTFDDGFREMSDVVAPILREKGVPATFFINRAFTDNKAMCHEQKRSILLEKTKSGLNPYVRKSVVDMFEQINIKVDNLESGILALSFSDRHLLDMIADYLDVDFDEYLAVNKPYLEASQVRNLIENGFSIGSHSIDHPVYGEISYDEQVSQTIESTKWVRETYGLDYGAFAFPYTDRYVNEEYFSEIRSSGLVDVSFGTGGMINGNLSFNLKRFSMEKPLLPAEKIIQIHYAKKLSNGLTKRKTNKRNNG